MAREKRFFDCEVRMAGDGDQPIIEGYAAVFDWSPLMWGWFREKPMPGAFVNSIGRDDVRGLKNHDPNFVLGRNRAGTLKLAEDSRGLHFELTPPAKQQWVRDLADSMERGDISGGSFQFDAVNVRWSSHKSDEGHEEERRELLEVRLYDISVVTFPFYPQADTHVRSVAEFEQSLKSADLAVNDEVMQRMRQRLGSGAGAGDDARARSSKARERLLRF